MITMNPIPVYPTNNLIAIIDDAKPAEQAAEALRLAGFAADDVQVAHGREDLEQLRARIAAEGLVRRAWRSAMWTLDEVTHIGDAPNTARHYFDALADGKSNLLVYCPTEETRDKAASIVRAAGGHSLTHVGTWNKEIL